MEFLQFVFGLSSMVCCVTAKIIIGQPEQIHISFGASNGTMVVMWASREQTKGVVKYGKRPNELQLIAESDVSKMADEEFKAAQYVHRAELVNLTLGSTYFYRVESLDIQDGTTANISDVFSFNTLPINQSSSAKFLVYGDLGVYGDIPTYGQLERYAKTGDYAAILHVGDFAYDLHTGNGEVGDLFMNKIQPFAANVPYMTCPGNHEIPEDFRPYRTRFSSPGVPWPIPVAQMWHSFDAGLVHFISYSSEVYFTNNSMYVCAQFDWLLKDLTVANQNRDKTPWIVAIGHRPMYCSNNNSDDCTFRSHRLAVKNGLEELFYVQGVDLIIQAHEHSYERFWPMYDYHVTEYAYNNPRAPTHIISGAAGNIEIIDWMKKGPAMSWSAVRADQTSRFSFGILEVYNRSHINFKQINATNDHLIDNFWLVQNNHGPFVPNVSCRGNRKHSSCTCSTSSRAKGNIDGILIVFVIELLVMAAGMAVVLRCSLKKRKRAYSRLPLSDQDTNTK